MGAEKFGAKEHVLNFTAQRFQLTRPGAVGPTMELINECNPTSLKQWEDFYWREAKTRKKDSTKITPEYIEGLGKKLFDKIENTIKPMWLEALSTVTEDDCIEYIKDVTINRTFDGYHRENAVIRELGVYFQDFLDFEKTDSITDSALNIDFIGHLKKSNLKIGIQVKPTTARSNSLSGYSIEDRSRKSFDEFKQRFGGPVFVVFAKKIGKKKCIVNRDVFQSIEAFLSET